MPFWTTRLWPRRAALAVALGCALAGTPGSRPAQAAIETDPVALYQTMRKAFDEGATKGWPFASELYYQTTVFDAGRAYSLFRPDDAQYGEIAVLAVDVASQLHYNPLTNEDAAVWYVHEVCTWVSQHGDPEHQAKAVALLRRVSAGESDPRMLAAQADEDARDTAHDFHNDGDALIEVLIAEVRAYNLTRDGHYRSMALEHAADPAMPLVRVPDPESSELFAFANQAENDPGYTSADRTNAKAILDRRAHTPELQIIGRVSAIPHELRMTRIAPADEYFGNLKMSPLGVHNEIVRLNKYLDVGWGDRMAPDALQVDSAVEDWQHQYPHDQTLPAALLDTYKLLVRVGAHDTRLAALRVKTVLLVQYAGTRQAQELASS